MKSFAKGMNQADLTFKLKHTFCQDPGCWSCAQGKGHGPFWHATYEEKGQVHTVYLGENFDPFELKTESGHANAESNAETKSTVNSKTRNTAENRFRADSKTTFRAISNKKPANFCAPQRSEQLTDDLMPPTRFDFERDLKNLKKTYRPDNLKTLYRKLTKKYHPDKYPGISHINTWMAEINGQYSQLKKSIGF